jgi:hypothetical protein
MTITWPQLSSAAPIDAHRSPSESEILPSAMRSRQGTVAQPPRSAESLPAVPARRVESALWSDIQAPVTEYCDGRAPAGDWHINRDVFGSEALTFNFFFPLRRDSKAVSLALTSLRGRPTHLESLDVLPPTMTEAIDASGTPPFSDVVISYRDDAGSGLLLVRCAFMEADLGACPGRMGFRRKGHRRNEAPEAARCSVSPRCPYLQGLPGLLPEGDRVAARAPCPFAAGGHQVLRGLTLARTIAAAWNADTVDFGLVFDRRNTALASKACLWRSRVQFPLWTYQGILAALGAGNARRMGSWRAFLSERYGLVPAA